MNSMRPSLSVEDEDVIFYGREYLSSECSSFEGVASTSVFNIPCLQYSYSLAF